MKSRPPLSPPLGARAWIGALLAVLALAVLPAAASAAPGWTATDEIAESGGAGELDVAVDRAGNAALIGTWRLTVSVASRTADGEWSQPQSIGTWGSSPSVALAPDGTAIAVWNKMTSKPEYEVWTASRDAAGSWSEAELLSSADASAQPTRPTLVVDRVGNVTVAWVQNCSVYSVRRPANGDWSAPTALWTDPVPAELSEPCANYRLEPGADQVFGQAVLDLGVDAAGNVTVVWRSGKRLPSSQKTIRAAVRPAGGSSTWSAARTIAAPTLKARAPRIQVWEDGRAIVTWGIEALGARAAVRPAGADQPFGAPQVLSEVGSPDPVSAYDGHGNATVVWEAPAAGGDPATLQTGTLGVGGSWGTAATAATLEAGTEAMNPRLVVSQGGDTILAWNREGGQRVLQSARRAAGGSWEAIVTHGDEKTSESFPIPALAGDPLGNAVLAWPGAGMWLGFPSAVAHVSDYAANPALRADWTANGLVGTQNLHSWLDYLYGGGGVAEVSAGATWPEPDDRYSYRLGTSDAWIEQSSGETVVQLQGAIRFNFPGHHIDIRIVDPQIRVAADGKTARVIADGQGSGDMAEAIKGNPKVEPFSDLHLLNLTLPLKLVSRDGSVQSWTAAAAKIAPGDAGRILSYSAGSPYGFFTFSAPGNLPARDTRPSEPGPGPGANPSPDPGAGALPAALPPAPVAAKPKALVCKKGQKKGKGKGKQRCVKKQAGKGKRKGAGKR
ncbi:MAG TPA: HtaA domain-containing protein [Solirubrobacterales bacterium]|nr:HtaA domain-containing protein [Solirubrobacterales bacterium]